MTKAELFLQLKKEGLSKEEALQLINSDDNTSLVSVEETKTNEAKTSEDDNIETTEVTQAKNTNESEVTPTSSMVIPEGFVLIRESDLVSIRQKGAIANTETTIAQPKSADDILAKLIDGGN